MMRRVFSATVVAAGTVIGLQAALWSSTVLAQSNSRIYRSPGSSRQTAQPSGSGGRVGQQAPLALEGYCPVSIAVQRKWVRGDPAYWSVYDGHTYLFATPEAKATFDADPARYVPALGGECVVTFVKTGRRVAGQIRYAAIHEGRLFLFASDEAQQMFLAEPARYAKADLAYGGYCVVCQVGMGKAVPGKPEIAVVHKGLRYLFASEDQRRQFLANPSRYEVKASVPGVAVPGSGSRTPPAGSSSKPTAGSESKAR